ncbi:MAG: hypothetical protein HC769_05205 [Cyanobacteria bacterium CRU_2_1]|nr:hypothetical protein [Cyanobacteria bacterium RU_5_0]NJR58297.1 hypothetical protein [Cyanobacteria bacterium CRU_2_1]
MRQTQSEIREIEAQLRSIRADDSTARRSSHSVLEPSNHSDYQPSSTNPIPVFGQNQSQNQSQSRSQKAAQCRPTPMSQVQSSPTAQRYVSPELADMVEQLRQQSASYLQQLQSSRSPHSSQSYLDHAWQALEAKAQHINHLSAAQEAALLELKAIAEQVERDRQAIESKSPRSGKVSAIPPICEYLEAMVPQIEKNPDGMLILTTRSIDLFNPKRGNAKREATSTAQTLCDRADRGTPSPSKNQPEQSQQNFWHRLSGFTGIVSEPDRHSSVQPDPQPQPPMRTQLHAPAQRSPQPLPRKAIRRSRSRSRAKDAGFSWREGITLMIGAILIRVLLDLLLATYPILWTPAIALMVTPAAIAVYRTSVTPQSGFVWGYRLLMIMLGLLLGGRLL